MSLAYLLIFLSLNSAVMSASSIRPSIIDVVRDAILFGDVDFDIP
jgi:hypothetical protein